MNETTITREGTNQLTVVRDFDAQPDEVWRAWTEAELLDQWWAPRPWKTRTKSMDFRPGGTWLYAMEGPEGEKNWCRADFVNVEPGKSFSASEGFCDENGEMVTDMPGMHWMVSFTKTPNGTRVTVVISFASEADREKIISMGFREGFTSAHGNLDDLLAGKAA